MSPDSEINVTQNHMHSRRNRRNPLDQMIRQFLSPPPSVEQYGALRQAMVTLEDSIYQYNRNFREYNLNIRQMDQHLHHLMQELRRPHAVQESVSFSFAPNESSSMSDNDLMTHVRTLQYDEVSMSTLTHCPISLDIFRQGEDLCEILGCGHVFKRDPLLQWLRRTPVCPVCRHDLRQSTAPAAATPAAATPITHFLQNLMTTRDVSGGGLMYEFELPLEMLAQSLQQYFRDNEIVDDYLLD